MTLWLCCSIFLVGNTLISTQICFIRFVSRFRTLLVWVSMLRHPSGTNSFVPIDLKFCCIHDDDSWNYFLPIFPKCKAYVQLCAVVVCLVMQDSMPIYNIYANETNRLPFFISIVYTSILSLLSVPVKGSVQHISSGSVKSIILLRGDKSYIVVSSHSGWTWWTSLTRTPPPRKNTSSLGHLNTKKGTSQNSGIQKGQTSHVSSSKLTIPFVSRHLGWVDIILCWRVHLNPQDSLMLHF